MITSDRRASLADPVGRALVPHRLAVAAAWSWRLLVIAAAAAGLVWVLLQLRIVVLPVLLALVATSVLSPSARWLRRRGWPGLLATWAVILAAVLVSGAVVAGLSWQAAGSADDLDVSLDQGVAEVEDWLVEGPLDLPRERVEEVDRQARDWLSSGDGLISSIGVDEARLAVEVVAGILLAIVLTFFFVKDGERIWRWLTQDSGAVPARTWTRRAGVRGAPSAPSSGARRSSPRSTPCSSGSPWRCSACRSWCRWRCSPSSAGSFPGGRRGRRRAGGARRPRQRGVRDGADPARGRHRGPADRGRRAAARRDGAGAALHPIAILLAVAAGAALGGIVGAFIAVPVTAASVAIAGYAWERPGRRRLPAIRAPPRSGISGEAARFPRCPAGYQSAVARIKLTYWALISVLGALTSSSWPPGRACCAGAWVGTRRTADRRTRGRVKRPSAPLGRDHRAGSGDEGPPR